MRELMIEEKDAGQRLDKYLRRYFSKAPSSLLYKLLRKKNIELNHKKASGSEMLRTGDHIGLYLSDETIEKFLSTEEDGKKAEFEQAYLRLRKQVSVLYENEHILLAVKDRGVLSQKALNSDVSLNEWIVGYLMAQNQIDYSNLRQFRPSVCNRLDRNTGGLVICAKTRLGSNEMARILKDRSLHKYYLCRVKGHFQGNGIYEGFLVKDKSANKVTFYRERKDIPPYCIDVAEEIKTQFTLVKKEGDCSVVEVLLITGKSHQIRAHLESLGYPIVGDVKYDGYRHPQSKAGVKETHMKTSGQCLFSYKLVFPKLCEELSDLSGREFHAEIPAYICDNF